MFNHPMGGPGMGGAGSRWPAGTRRPIQSVAEVQPGISCVAIQGTPQVKMGTEVTVKKIEGSRVHVEAPRKRKFVLEMGKFCQSFERRLGPVVQESIQPGLTCRAMADGETFRRGTVVTFNETSGRVYGFTTSTGGRGSAKADEVTFYFEYV